MRAAGGSRNSEAIQRFYEYSLLGMLASGCLAIAGSGYLSPLPLLLTAAALVVRALMATGVVQFRLPARAAAILTLIYVGFYPVDYFFVSRSFLTSTVHLIFFLVITKILTASTSRDYFYVKVIALMELLAACLLSANSNFFLFLGLFLFFTVAALASGEMRHSLLKSDNTVLAKPRFRPNSLVFFATSVSAGILVMTAGLFFLLPRTARAAMQHLLPSRYHLSGFSNQVDLGEIGEIERMNTPVMHVETVGRRPLPPSLKWRGASLAEFDGKRWFNPAGLQQTLEPEAEKRSLYILATPSDRRRNAARLTYIVHLNEIAGNALFFAGRPEFIWIDTPFLVESAPGVVRRQYGSSGPVTYQAQSFLDTGNDGTTPMAADDSLLASAYLQLPDLDPRIPELTRQITREITGPLARARAIENYLRRNYGYTLDLPATEPRDPLANFLFSRRKGHCEYFSSAMAVMARTLGIPTRVITGFQSGIYNPVSGQQLIRASDAHSWVEAWIPDKGWVTFDPTPPDLSLHQPTLFSHISLYFDAAEVFWQEWVLSYSRDHQLLLASRMEESGKQLRTSWPERIGALLSQGSFEVSGAAARWKWVLLPTACTALLLIFFGSDLWRFLSAGIRFQRAKRRQSTPGDATILYSRLLRQLRKRGLEKPPWLTPVEFARMVREPELGGLAREITDAYNEVRFGRHPAGAARMVELLGKME